MSLLVRSAGGGVQRTPAARGRTIRLESRSAQRRCYRGLSRSETSGVRDKISSMPQTGITSGLSFGHWATTDGSMLKCCATRAGGLWVNQSDSETSA